jgi:hypothetical protein
MSTSELLDRTFALYKRNFALFAGISLPASIIVLVTQLAQFWLFRDIFAAVQHPAPNLNPAMFFANMGRFFAATGISMIAWMIGFSVTYAATTRAVSAVHLEREITVRQSFQNLPYGRVLAIVVCWLILFLLLSLGAGIGAGIIIALAIAGGGVLGILGKFVGGTIGVAAGIGAVVLVFWVLARYSLSVQACVVEGRGVVASMKRSAALAKGSVGRIVTVYVLFVLIKLSIGGAAQLAATLLAAAIHSLWFVLVFQALAGFAVAVMVSPLVAVSMSLVYYDERVRKEAFDLQLMMAALDGPAAGLAASAS